MRFDDHGVKLTWQEGENLLIYFGECHHYLCMNMMSLFVQKIFHVVFTDHSISSMPLAILDSCIYHFSYISLIMHVDDLRMTQKFQKIFSMLF